MRIYHFLYSINAVDDKCTVIRLFLATYSVKEQRDIMNLSGDSFDYEFRSSNFAYSIF
jgi:hypothetical protein